MRKPLLVLLVIFFFLASIVISFGLYIQNNIAPSQSNASADGKLLLKLVTPTSLVGVSNNTRATFALYAENTQDANVVEVILNFDPRVLSGVQILEDSSILLALNKKIDNTNGKITVDLAYTGDGAIPADVNLVTFDFDIVNNSKSNTRLSIVQGSTLGVPNKLSSSGMGSLPIKFSPESLNSASQPICGNNNIEVGEECDDGNTRNGDSCSNICKTEQFQNNGENTSIIPSPRDNPSQGNNDQHNNLPVTSDEFGNGIDNSNNESNIDNQSTTTATRPMTSDTNTIKPTTSIINQNVLIVTLFLTIAGTIVSLFLLIRTLFMKKNSTNNLNPFM